MIDSERRELFEEAEDLKRMLAASERNGVRDALNFLYAHLEGETTNDGRAALKNVIAQIEAMTTEGAE